MSTTANGSSRARNDSTTVAGSLECSPTRSPATCSTVAPGRAGWWRLSSRRWRSARSRWRTSGVRGGVVGGEHVAAEVRVEVAPDRVHVVDAALGVVVLGQHPATLDAVVVRFAGEHTAGPAEGEL